LSNEGTSFLHDLLEALRPVSFTLTTDEDQRKRFGFIAQELEDILPNIVVTNGGYNETEPGTKSVLYQDLIAVLTAVVQEQQDTIFRLTDKISRLERERASHKDAIGGIERKLQLMENVLQSLLKQATTDIAENLIK
jgi:hypothetical protein